MSNVIFLSKSNSQYHFAVYELPITDAANNLGCARFIVIKNKYDIVVRFTGFEQYSRPFTGRKQPIKMRSRHELEYICNALNHIIFSDSTKEKPTSVARIDAKSIIDYFEFYRTEQKPDGGHRGQQSIDKCVRSVSNFFANASLAAGALAVFEPTELLMPIYTRQKRESKKGVLSYQPIYQERMVQAKRKPIFRDIPFAAMEILWDVCRTYMPEIYFAIVAQCTAGLRPGEVMNMRREDSPLGRGLATTMHGSRISKIEIDLRQELLLRGDGTSVGKIKRERIQQVYKIYNERFYAAYQQHMLWLNSKKFEADFAPMFINKQGRAMTYETYKQKFKKLVYEYLRPRLLNADAPELQVFGHRLATESLTPHACRHFFTVSMVLCGEDIAQIQHYRGDSSPGSALAYMKNKGALVKALEDAHSELMHGLLIVGEKENALKL